MIVSFDCPSCNEVIEAELKGSKRRLVNCPSCEKGVQIPDDVGVGPGVVIGNGYKLDEKVGESHVGEIYLATKQDEGELVRVEILTGDMTEDEEAVTRFLQEVELLSSLKHPNLLGAIEAGQDNETYFLVTAHEPGMVSLERYLQEHSPLEEAVAAKFIASIGDVLSYAWQERKILHRDVKPQNIFITESGEAKLSGFTIAKSSEGQSMGLTGVGFTIGTPEYMSPEQIKAADDLDFRSDMYALGVVFYECVAGELPFNENAPILLMQKHMDETPEPVISRNPNVSEACSALVDRMLAKSPEERAESWEDLVSELRGLVGSGGASPSQQSSSTASASTGSDSAEKASVPPTSVTSSGDAGGGPPLNLIIGGAIVVLLLIIIIMQIVK